MKKKKKKPCGGFKDIFFYCIFGFTLLLSIILVLSWTNICYLPINTTGECVIARSIMSLDYFLVFLIFESIFSGIVTILYLIDGFRDNIKMYKIIGIANILLQPLIILGLINIVERLKW